MGGARGWAECTAYNVAYGCNRTTVDRESQNLVNQDTRTCTYMYKLRLHYNTKTSG